MDVTTNTTFYDKLRYIFVELPKFKKTVDELKTDEDGWLYSLKNMEKLEEIPVSLRKKKVFRELYQLAEVINLSPEDMNAYQQSLKIKRDNYSALESAEWRGEQRGIEMGAELEKREMAVKLKTKGMRLEEIAELTKFSIEEIVNL